MAKYHPAIERMLLDSQRAASRDASEKAELEQVVREGALVTGVLRVTARWRKSGWCCTWSHNGAAITKAKAVSLMYRSDCFDSNAQTA